MFLRRATTIPKKKPTVITNTADNIFLDPLIQAAAKPMTDTSSSANTALHDLMQFYITEAARTVKVVGVDVGVRRHKYKHTAEANVCINILSEKTGPAAITEVIQYLHTIHAGIYAAGSFAQLISTFFAAYPQYLPLCSEELRALMTPMDLWESYLASTINTLNTTPHKSHLADKPELLEHISNVIPENMMDKYADYLLAQLKKSPANESTSGLYQGWVYSALGTLLPKLNNTAKISAIKTALHAGFTNHNNDFSLIGLCEAMCKAGMEENQLAAAAEQLYRYTTNELRSITALHEDHRSVTIKSYVKKTFRVLKTLEKHLDNDEYRNSLLTPMLAPECAYLLRDGILALESWASPERKIKFMNDLNSYNDFLRLAPQFWHWLEFDKNHQTVWGVRNIYSPHLAMAQNDLKQIQILETQAADQARYLVADNSTGSPLRADIIERLVEELTDHNHDLDANEIRIELHRAFIAILPWANSNECAAIAKILQSGCRPKRYEADNVRVSAGAAAAAYAKYLTPADTLTLLYDLVPLLNGNHAEQIQEVQADQAAAAINVLAANLTDDALKTLMTSVMSIDNAAAQILLFDLHQLHRNLQPKPEAESAQRLVM